MGYEILSSEKHSGLRIKQGSFSYLEKVPFIQISILEVSLACLDFPIAFLKNTNGFSLAAVASLSEETNCQITPDGKWMGGYMPALIRAYPFAAVYKDDKFVVLITKGSDCISETEGEFLFDSSGKPTSILETRLDLLKKFAGNPMAEKKIFDLIAKSSVLEPWSEISDRLYRVNPNKFAALEDNIFLELRKTAALSLIYAHLLSMHRLERIKTLSKVKKQLEDKTGSTSSGLFAEKSLI